MAALLSKTFKIEIFEGAETTARAARRVILNSEFLKASKLCTGDVVALCNAETPLASCKNYAIGVVWPSLDIPQDVMLISTSLLLTAALSPLPSNNTQRGRIFPLSGLAATTKLPPGVPSLRQVSEAGVIKINEVRIPTSEGGEGGKRPSGSTRKVSAGKAKEKGKEGPDWLALASREVLVDLKYITGNQTIEFTYEGTPRRFVVQSILPKGSQEPKGDADSDSLSRELNKLSLEGDDSKSRSKSQIWSTSWDCTVTIVDGSEKMTVEDPQSTEIEVLPHMSENAAYASVGGLGKQIEAIRDLLEIPLTRPELFRHFGLKPPRGILLHGPPGTGKTHLARAIAASTDSRVLVINGPELSSAYHGETESKLRAVFAQARASAPCIVVIDEVDALVPRREEGAGGEVEKRVVATLLTLLDGMEQDSDKEKDKQGAPGAGEDRVVVIGTTNRPNAIDPALRRPGRFDREIEIGIPDADARFSIFNVLLANTPHDVTPQELRALAGRMHGYVGADIGAVVREAGTIAIKKWLASTSGSRAQIRAEQVPIDSEGVSASHVTHASSTSKPILTLADLNAAMPAIRPSAMRSLFVETPPVRYADIGGQAGVIQKLKEAIEWPLLHPEAFSRLGVRPPKGVLLYGPPGCSKTVLARACATESGINFVAVKGPELLNKFVGESERAVREIFRKARAASPSIIFFDEIDALATSRASDTTMGSSHEGVLTSLLNEMDGVQELTGVTVVAATNRPEAIDSALMRPGRLDRILFVGPPDRAGREDILCIRMKTMTVGPDIDVPRLAELTDGCSGAEITSLCQEAAIITMQKDMNAPYVPQAAFADAAKTMKRQITPSVLDRFARWRDANERR